MAFKVFTAGATLPAADLNTYLMQQAVIVCTAATHPGSPVQGQFVYETDTDSFKYWNGSLWRPVSTAGTVTATTSAAGSIASTAHGLGVLPAYIGIQQSTAPNQALAIRVSAKSSTTFDVNIRDCSTGAALNAVSVTFDWLAR